MARVDTTVVVGSKMVATKMVMTTGMIKTVAGGPSTIVVTSVTTVGRAGTAGTTSTSAAGTTVRTTNSTVATVVVSMGSVIL